ncbi:hypothetical protein HIM_07500 [Hirsutella minnesotensis 3608]|uniref:Calcineurin-like phosphoesterase domain-containing protein n=1 Tax=Hirsutella minnesotensis 3608 TaxID=1043627 RepID=A0A0F7ZHS0_9HYPO|nr:hypothetical protein HIM_07500 [Hirsutella minnesotensis 3608]
MSTSTQPLTTIQTRGHRKRKLADRLIAAHRRGRPRPEARSDENHIRIVCIADTHNKRPAVLDGDIVIHAGDLTENGSFDEMQEGLRWLSSLPHAHKVLVAGNHDLLLDDAFLAKYPERRYGHEKTRHDLDWGDVVYLQDSAVTLEIPRVEPGEGAHDGTPEADRPGVRRITIFGSPWTPKYGISAFQYPPNNTTHWENVFQDIPKDIDIIITHGPPRLHLDKRDFHRAGCPYLAEEIYRIRPRLNVFGHIHASYGREDVVLDGVESAYQTVMIGWAGWGTILWMGIKVAVGRVKKSLGLPGSGKTTSFVNAAAVGGPSNELRNDPIVFDM